LEERGKSWEPERAIGLSSWRGAKRPSGETYRPHVEKGQRRGLKGLISEIRGDRSRPHQTLVARGEERRFAGYIWLSENTDYFTGQNQAFVLDIYVEEKQRRKGLGQRLLSLRDPVRRTG